MALNPWYKVATLRKEVREGRSFSPDEFAIALEQVVAGTAPPDYRDPAQFFSRTCFTRALREHSGMVLRRLTGDTANTAPVLTLVTQFGGGKTHTLTSLYHIANAGPKAFDLPGVGDLLQEAGLSRMRAARVGVFVGNAWDPADGRETPWIDLARQVAGDEGVAALGTASASTPPGTEAIGRVIALADAPVLFLFDEVLNFVNRHRGMAESFHAFIQNLTVAVTGATGAAAVISLPRSQVEMTDWDQQWQERITKVVRRVAKDLIANDEAEIGEVVRRRLFSDLGSERIRARVARTYADWCFERTARLPAEWLAVDTATTEAKAREALKNRFKACYPFHPATLSVFHRKWRALAQFQQTRGALAMLAQWVSWAARRHFTEARTEALITLGSAPLHVEEFRAVVLGQLGEARLDAAIAADIAGEAPHARALDADTRGPLRDIHRRVGSAILFESSGGQVDKVAHLPELRFALGEPDVETTTVDNAAAALEAASFFIRKVGADGYRIHHQATLRKVVSDRRASLDDETEVRPAVRKLVEAEFKRNTALRLAMFPEDGAAIPDSPRLTIAVADLAVEWTGSGDVLERLERWTTHRGESPRLYPGAVVWCVRKPGRELRDRTELWLAWKRVGREVADGILGAEFDPSDRAGVAAKVRTAEEEARDEVWGGYRYVLLADRRAEGGLRVIDLGAGHSSPSDTLSGRVVRALKTDALLNDSVGAGYIERHWPPAFKDSGAWPLAGLRKSFLDGSLTRLVDADAVLRDKIPRFVANGDFGLASGARDDGGYDRWWYRELLPPEEMAFEADIFLLTRAKADELTSAQETAEATGTEPDTRPEPDDPDTREDEKPGTDPDSPERAETGQTTLRLAGDIPSELWNRFGTRVLPKLRGGDDLAVRIDSSVLISAGSFENLSRELRQALEDLGLDHRLQIEREEP
ncbi:DUF499 domain-containing protein [Candidatus Palauibacter sp.]|uniref:DUF499 domain-containing protein n=1 Tax=Candidatus Palauibacter sp. TaxID=3101350 RepID=UPI003B594BAC